MFLFSDLVSEGLGDGSATTVCVSAPAPAASDRKVSFSDGAYKSCFVDHDAPHHIRKAVRRKGD